MSRIVRFYTFGGPEILKIEDAPSQQSGPGEVRLRVEAAGLNRDQFTFMSGHHFIGHGFVQPKLPSRIGYEVSGVVDAVGEGVDRSWIGKRVAPVAPFDQNLYGALGKEAVVPADILVEYPSNLTPAQASAFWVPYLTAYGPLVAIARVKQGDFVSIPAASSAVGLAAIQIVRDSGATSVAVTRASAKKDELQSLGADHVIVTQEEDYERRISEITGGNGVRITFDPVGGPFLEQLASASAPGGIIIEYGRLSGQPAPFHKWMRQRNIRHRLDFDHLQDSQIGSPSLKEKKRIVIAVEVLRHGAAASDGTIEHPAESHTVDCSGVHAKPNDSARELIHDDEDPVRTQCCRLAAKQVHAPETVFRLTQESQPGRTAGVRSWSVMSGQDASDNVLINGNAESQGKLLSDSRAAPGGIVLFHVDNGVDDFPGRPLWPGTAHAFLREQHAVLSPSQRPVEVQKGRGFQDDGRTDQASRTHEQGAQSCDETIGCPGLRCAQSGSIQDQELLLDENGLRDHGADAARIHKSGNGGNDMDEKNEEIAHCSIVARSANTGNCRANEQFAIDTTEISVKRWKSDSRGLWQESSVQPLAVRLNVFTSRDRRKYHPVRGRRKALPLPLVLTLTKY